MTAQADSQPIEFRAHPDSYKHWRLQTEGATARLVLNVDEAHPLREGYALKLNSYDLAVDIELADAVERLRFEHPEVKAVVITSGHPSCFCAGANIYMLRSSSHGFKVNFCKYTNETRLALEEACSESDQHYIAALNGITSGGGLRAGARLRRDPAPGRWQQQRVLSRNAAVGGAARHRWAHPLGGQAQGAPRSG